MTSTRSYLALSAAIFAVVALAHLVRALAGWTVSVDGADVPLGVSWIAAAAASLLAMWSLSLLRRCPR